MVWPGVTGSGPAPSLQSVPGASTSVLSTLSGAAGGALPTCVLTSADVLFSSLLSAIVLSGSSEAVLVMGPLVPGDVALIVTVPFAPAFTRPPLHVTVMTAGGCGSAGSSLPQ